MRGGALVLLLAAVGLGCSASRTAVQDKPAYPPEFRQDVYPFAVLRSDGTTLDHPFYGGFNLPRPQFADIDADGDLDLFVQEVTGYVKFFENTGTSSEPAFVWRSDQYEGLDVGEWFRIVDLDQDGDLDILAETPFSYLRLFRNEGTPEAPAFTTVLDSLRGADGAPLFADRQNIPTLTDLDCDGQLDLFIGRVDGTVLRYESVGNNEEGIPQFSLITRRFEDIEIVNQFMSLHGANALVFHDVDDDGDKDLFWGDFFEPGVLLIPNTGTCELPNLRNEPVPFPISDPVATSGYNAPLFADLNGDGTDEFLLGVLGGAFNPHTSSVDNFYQFTLTQEDFELHSKTFLPSIDVGSDSYPVFADLDADGDQDLILANKISETDFNSGQVYYYENLSESGTVQFQERGTILPLTGHFHFAPAFGDLDADGDLDMFTGTWNKGILYWRNDGSAQESNFAQVENMTVQLTRGSNSSPALVDIDADGDLDLFVGESSGDLNFYRNTGSGEAPFFELVSDKFEGIDVGRRSVPRFVDIDYDGDMDMLVGREFDGVALYLNNGSAAEPLFEEAGILDVRVPVYGVPAMVDIDQDGDLDLFTGSISGGLLFFRNIAQ